MSDACNESAMANGRNIRQQTVDFVLKILWLRDELTEADSDEKKALLWKLARFSESAINRKVTDAGFQ